MPECASHFVETLLILSEDEVQEVSNKSKKTLQIFSRKCQDHNAKSLIEILEENFYGLTTRLPRILRSTGKFSFYVHCIYIQPNLLAIYHYEGF